MATRIGTRAIQQAAQNPSRLLPFLRKPTFLQPNVAPFLDDHSRQPWVPFGFPDAGRSHGSFFFLNKFIPQVDAQQTQIRKLEPIPFKLHLQESAPEALWKLTNSSYLPPSSEIDEVILPSHHEDTTSPMLMNTKRTFNPSTIVRKRRHGFLARKATVGGRRILARRFLKGRRRLSA